MKAKIVVMLQDEEDDWHVAKDGELLDLLDEVRTMAQLDDGGLIHHITICLTPDECAAEAAAEEAANAG